MGAFHALILLTRACLQFHSQLLPNPGSNCVFRGPRLTVVYSPSLFLIHSATAISIRNSRVRKVRTRWKRCLGPCGPEEATGRSSLPSPCLRLFALVLRRIVPVMQIRRNRAIWTIITWIRLLCRVQHLVGVFLLPGNDSPRYRRSLDAFQD